MNVLCCLIKYLLRFFIITIIQELLLLYFNLSLETALNNILRVISSATLFAWNSEIQKNLNGESVEKEAKCYSARKTNVNRGRLLLHPNCLTCHPIHQHDRNTKTVFPLFFHVVIWGYLSILLVDSITILIK